MRLNQTLESLKDNKDKVIAAGTLSALAIVGLAACSPASEATPTPAKTTQEEVEVTESSTPDTTPSLESPSPSDLDDGEETVPVPVEGTETVSEDVAVDPETVITPENRWEEWDKMSYDEYINSFEISANDYTTEEEVLEAYYDRFNRYMATGLTVQGQELRYNDEANFTNLREQFDNSIHEKLYTTYALRSDGLVESIQTALREPTIRTFSYTHHYEKDDPTLPDLENEPYEYLSKPSNTELISGGVDEGYFTVRTELNISDNGERDNAAGHYRTQITTGPYTIDATRYEEITFVLNEQENIWQNEKVILYQETDDRSDYPYYP